MTSDRTQAVVFIILVLAISWGLEAYIIANGGVRSFGPLWIVALMCIPGLLSVVLRIALRSGYGDIGIRVGSARFYAYAFAIPLSAAVLVVLVSSVLDIRTPVLASPAQLVQVGPVLLTILGLGLIGAFGEELGWRGFLLPKLMSGAVNRPYLVCSIVWAAWHLPLIALGGFYETGNPWLMATTYALGIIAMSFVFSELRMRSGSVWVAAIAHAAHNFILQFAIPVLVLTAPGSRAALWDLLASDTGLCIALLYAGAYLVLRRFRAGRRESHPTFP